MPNGDLLWHTPLTPQMTEVALDALEGRDEFDIMAYHRNDIYVRKMSWWAMDYGERNSIPIRVVDQDEIRSGPMTRLVVRGDDDAIESLEIELNDRFDGDLYVTRSLSYFCEILHPDAGKDKAIGMAVRAPGHQPQRHPRFRKRVQRHTDAQHGRTGCSG